jgi:XTP/dITP diphosphohydrolase
MLEREPSTLLRIFNQHSFAATSLQKNDMNQPIRRQLVLGTTNKKKIIEMRGLLEPLGFDILTLSDFPDAPEVDENGTTFIENAQIKAREQAKRLGLWTIGEDSGLCVPALGGKPGIYSARYSGPGATDATNNTLLLEHMQHLEHEARHAFYVSTIALSDPHGEIWLEASGECHGRLLKEHRGSGGFGYDPLFEVIEYHQTFAELGLAVKSAISHRARSLRRFLRGLTELIDANQWPAETTLRRTSASAIG